MPNETYSVPETPGFPIDSIRKILNTDPVNAEDFITPLVESLLELAAYLNKHKADLGENGKVLAEQLPDTGVTSFKGRKGAVTPQNGDYTAAQVGALALTGGTLTGPLIIGKVKLAWNAATASLDFEAVG